MRKICQTVVIVLLGQVPASGWSNCTIELSKSHLLDFKRAKSVVAPRYTEGIWLKGGLQVTYYSGGCAHYGYGFVFEKSDLRPPKLDKMKIDQALKWLRKVPVVDRKEVNELISGIRSAQKSKKYRKQNGALVFECGFVGATCRIHWQAGKLKIDYSFVP